MYLRLAPVDLDLVDFPWSQKTQALVYFQFRDTFKCFFYLVSNLEATPEDVL